MVVVSISSTITAAISRPWASCQRFVEGARTQSKALFSESGFLRGVTKETQEKRGPTARGEPLKGVKWMNFPEPLGRASQLHLKIVVERWQSCS